MKKIVLGRTGLEVTELCFGALPMGPIQKNIPVEECSELVAMALRSGINFIDTAQMYKTYEPIRVGMDKTGIKPVIATKSAAKTYEDMEKAILEALASLDVDFIDIFLLHAARAGVEVFEERSAAFQCMLDYKAKGKIKAVGISTHSVKVAEMAAKVNEIDIVFPIINITGKGILEGTRDEMQAAIQACLAAGKGVYLMKALAGGTLVDDYHNAMKYVRAISDSTPIALGMVNREELAFNLKYFETSNPVMEELPDIQQFKKSFFPVPSLCKGCKACVSTCPNYAIDMVDHKAVIHLDKCLQCGYCVGACKEFAIRMI